MIFFCLSRRVNLKCKSSHYLQGRFYFKIPFSLVFIIAGVDFNIFKKVRMMKKITIVAATLSFVFFNSGVLAKDTSKMQHSMKNMDSMMPMSKELMDAHMRAMQEHMLKMHDYSNKILAEKNPAKRQKLKTEQLELMKTHHKQMMIHRQKMKQMHQNMMK